MLPNGNTPVFNGLSYPFTGWMEIFYSWVTIYFIESIVIV